MSYEKKKLKDCCVSISDGDHQPPPKAETGVPFVTISNINSNNQLDFSDVMYVPEEYYDGLPANKKASVGDILYSVVGSFGKPVYISNSDKFVFQRHIAILKPNDEVDGKYLYYAMLNPLFYRMADKLAIGCAQRTITLDALRNIIVDIPPKEKQKTITDVLNALDRKVAVNNRINDNLQQMSKTIYDYWFTQFDFPNKDGKPYRSSGGSMMWDDDLKKEIPQGWASGQLSDIANITMGQSPEGSTYNEEQNGTVFFQGCTDFGNRFPEPRVYTTAPTRFAKAGDILMSVRAPVGTLNVALENCCIGRGLAALNSKYGSQLHLMYTLVMFKRLFDIMDSNGTTFGSITKDELYEMKVVIPPAEQMEAFERTVQPIEQKIKQCELENRELTRQRNWLLPMLMNGQATVSD